MTAQHLASSHYLPVLRWKRAERIALRYLEESDKDFMTPLIELVATSESSYESQEGPTVAAQIAKDWGQKAVLVDFTQRSSEAVSDMLISLSNAARKRGLQIIPVTGLKRSGEYQNAVSDIVRHDKRGVCVRLESAEIQRPTVIEHVESLLSSLEVEPDAVDLLLDYGLVAPHDPSIVYLCQRVPDVASWRSFVVVGGSFPKDLTQFQVGEHEHSREEWLRWSNEIRSERGRLLRLPSFGDYTIQHPIYYDPPEGANVSASIRYTSDTYWVIMRGEGLRNPGGAGSAQYPANAELLLNRKEFCGSHFSYGDAYIWQMGSHQSSTNGSPETWLRAGINHHLVFAIQQVAHFFTEEGIRADE